MSCSAQDLINTAVANGYDALSDRDLKEAILASACAGGGGGGGGSGTTCAAYGSGNPPSFTPSSGCALAFNTDDHTLWAYESGTWKPTGVVL